MTKLTTAKKKWRSFLTWCKPLGYCDKCHRFFVYPKRRRMNTQYHDKESNYCNVCLDCFNEIEEYWQERWDEYHRSCM